MLTSSYHHCSNTVSSIVSFVQIADRLSLILVDKAWSRAVAPILWEKLTPRTIAALTTLVNVLKDDIHSYHPYASFVHRLNLTEVPQHMDIDDQLFSAFKGCMNLRRLNISGCSQLSRSLLAELIPAFPELEYLGADGTMIDETVLHHIPSSLRALDLNRCPFVTDVAIIDIAERCSHLQRIEINHNGRIIDEGVIALVNHCPLLRIVQLRDCPNMTDRCIRHLWSYSENLRELTLEGNGNITDHGFIRDEEEIQGEEDSLPTRPSPAIHSNLRDLNLTGCSGLSDTAIEAIVTAAPKLRNITLKNCQNLTDEAIRSVCNLRSSLHYISLAHIKRWASGIMNRYI